MVFNFLKKHFGSEKDSGGTDSRQQAVAHEGYTIVPPPKQHKDGWPTEGLIEREVDGEIDTNLPQVLAADVEQIEVIGGDGDNVIDLIDVRSAIFSHTDPGTGDPITISINGSDGQDTIDGSTDLDDVILGGDGDDVIRGGTGSNHIDGGDGNDTFSVYGHSGGNNTITDFDPSGDTIDFGGADLSELAEFTITEHNGGTLIETGTGMIHAVNERLAAPRREKGLHLPSWARPTVALSFVGIAMSLTPLGLVDLIAQGYGTITWGFIVYYVIPILTVAVWMLWRVGANQKAG